MKLTSEEIESLKQYVSPTGSYLIPVKWVDYGLLSVTANNLYEALTKPLAGVQFDDIEEDVEWSPSRNDLEHNEDTADYYMSIQEDDVVTAGCMLGHAIDALSSINRAYNFYIWLQTVSEAVPDDPLCKDFSTENFTELIDSIRHAERQLNCKIRSWTLALADKIHLKYQTFHTAAIDIIKEIDRCHIDTPITFEYCTNTLNRLLVIYSHFVNGETTSERLYYIREFPEVRIRFNSAVQLPDNFIEVQTNEDE